MMKILVAFDGSDEAETALNAARRHARAFGAVLALVWSVLKGSEDESKIVETAERKLNHWKTELTREGLDCETHIVSQWLNVGEDLVYFAKEHQVEEIVIGVRKRSKLDKVVFGSIVQYVILNAPCPVLCVR